jgi:hypothetical protein
MERLMADTMTEPVEESETWERPTDPAERDALIDEALERIREANAEIAHNNAVAQRRMDTVALWRDGENGKVEARTAFWRQRIEALTAGYDYGKKRSRNLANGTFGLRTKPGRVEILDMAKAVEFARLSNLPVKVREEVAKSDLATLAKDGLHPSDDDGWTWLEPRDEFYVTPAPPIEGGQS